MNPTKKGNITLSNPDRPETDFRQNSQGNVNRGTINYGNGVTGKLGLIRGSGDEEVYAYVFDGEKYDEESAEEWLTNHRSKKAMKKFSFKNKKFKFNMPLYKADVEKDGYLYLEFALATTDVDLENEQLTSNALKDMVNQATGINVYLDHEYDLPHTVGPVIEAKVVGEVLWVKARVRKELEPTIQDILDSETKMGGSFGGFCEEDFLEEGIRKMDKVRLLDATFTPMPVNTATSGTGKASVNGCTVCNQIFKSIKDKYGLVDDLEVKNVTRTEEESYDAIMSAISAAINSKYGGPDGYSPVWLKLTFPDSCIIENWEEDKLYELPYSIDEEGIVTLGEPVEVMEQYVEKKLEVFKTKAYEHEEPADYKKKNVKGSESMDETKVQEMIDNSVKKSNDELFNKIKGLVQPDEDPKDPNPSEVKAIDEDLLTDKVTKGVLKALGIEEEEETPQDNGKLVIMDAKTFEDNQSELVKKTILGIVEAREGTRKSKSLGGSKFETPSEKEEKVEKTATGKMSTKDAAKAIAERKGLPVA